MGLILDLIMCANLNICSLIMPDQIIWSCYKNVDQRLHHHLQYCDVVKHIKIISFKKQTVKTPLKLTCWGQEWSTDQSPQHLHLKWVRDLLIVVVPFLKVLFCLYMKVVSFHIKCSVHWCKFKNFLILIFRPATGKNENMTKHMHCWNCICATFIYTKHKPDWLLGLYPKR